MPTQKHRFFVTLIAIALTGLITGGLVIGYYVYGAYQELLQNPDFLRKQLDVVVGTDREKPAVRAAALVRVAPARREMIDTIREFRGRLVEVQRAKILAEVSGLVVELPIEIGNQVKGGETLIAQIDKTWIELNVGQTEAEKAILQKQYEFQASEAERIEALALSRAVSESELSNQRTLLEQFRRNLEKAVIANDEAKERLKRTTILAPFDGYIIKREVGLGELLTSGTTIAEIVSLGYLDAYVYIVEDYINRIHIGDEMPIVIDKLGIKVVGKVHSIVPYAPTGTRSFPVLVRLNDRNGELKVGMAATALVATTDPREDIVVTKDAVLDKPEGAIVWIAVEDPENPNEDGSTAYRAKPVPVKITAKGIEDYGVEPETEEGRRFLVPEAKTIIEGAERLMVDQRVRIVNINPEIMENLPPVSGHKVIEPKERIGR